MIWRRALFGSIFAFWDCKKDSATQLWWTRVRQLLTWPCSGVFFSVCNRFFRCKTSCFPRDQHGRICTFMAVVSYLRALESCICSATGFFAVSISSRMIMLRQRLHGIYRPTILTFQLHYCMAMFIFTQLPRRETPWDDEQTPEKRFWDQIPWDVFHSDPTCLRYVQDIAPG